MPDLTHYDGDLPLRPHIVGFLDSLEREGFAVEVTKRHRPNTRRLTLVVRWRDVQVAYTKQDMWGGVDAALVGYRFQAGTAAAGNACPTGFDLQAFSDQYECGPLDFFVREDVGGNKSYLRIRNLDAALRVLRASAREVDELVFGESHDEQADVQKDLERDVQVIRKRTDISETTKQRMVDARVGQGQFRSDLERVFDRRCAVSGLALRQALRASHILAWSKANDEDRLDENNGLLLSANLDALFDKHLITFAHDGAIQVSPAITDQERAVLGPLGGLIARPSERQWHFLMQHNQLFDAAVRRHQESAVADD